MKGNYNTIAPFYDLLSRIVFGNAIIQSQRFLINAIPAGSSILIIGGGTGYILEEISKKFSKGLWIYYIDISEKMIALSKRKNIGDNQIVFINQSVVDVLLSQNFTVVITPFLLDNFKENSVKTVFDKLHASLQPGGLWLFADFEANEKSPLWKKAMLKVMYFFFRIFCNIEASHLPDTESLFNKYGYKMICRKGFFKAFICSKVYVKQ